MRNENRSTTGKRCSTCHVVMPLTDFNVRRLSNDGLQPRCRPCQKVESRKYRLANHEKERRRNHAWQRKNAVKVNLAVSGRKAFIRRSPVSSSDWARLVHRYGSRCAYCGSDGPLTIDHVVPISRGGQHAIGNLLPACGSCNYSKGSRFLVEWRRDRR